jgi:hypothetical protein
MRDHRRDGVDVEIVFPNKGLLVLGDARSAVLDGDVPSLEPLGPRSLPGYEASILPMAAIAPGDREGSLREIAWAAREGLKGLTLPCQPH